MVYMIIFRPQPLNNTRCWAELAGAVLHPIIYTRSASTDPTLELNEVTITPSVKITHQPVEQHHLVSRSTKCHSAKLPIKTRYNKGRSAQPPSTFPTVRNRGMILQVMPLCPVLESSALLECLFLLWYYGVFLKKNLNPLLTLELM